MPTLPEILAKLPQSIQRLSEEAALVDEVTVRGGSLIIPSDGEIQLTHTVINAETLAVSPGAEETLIIGGVTFEQVANKSELAPGTFRVFRPGSRVQVSPTYAGQAVEQLRYYHIGRHATAEDTQLIVDALRAAGEAIETIDVPAPVLRLRDLADVADIDPEDGQALVYRADLDRWYPATIEGGTVEYPPVVSGVLTQNEDETGFDVQCEVSV